MPATLDEADLEEYNSWFQNPQQEFEYLQNGFNNEISLDPTDIDPFIDSFGTANDYQYTPDSSDSGNYSPGSSNDGLNQADMSDSRFFSSLNDSFASSDRLFDSQTAVSPPTQSYYEHYEPALESPIIRPVKSSPPPCTKPPESLPTVPITAVPVNAVLVRPVTFVQAVPCTSNVIVTQPPPFTISSSAVSQVKPPLGEDDDQTRRNEDRKLRNRAAAAASRERKRLEQNILKIKLEEVEEECERLRKENEELRTRLRYYEDEKSAPTLPHKRAKTAGACLAMCALLFTISNSFTSPPPKSTELQLAPSSDLVFVQEHHGRSIPEVDYSDTFESHEPLTNCTSQYMNVTEKIRLNKDLTGWIRRHELLNLVELRKGVDPFLIYNSPKSFHLKSFNTSSNPTVGSNTSPDPIRKMVASRRIKNLQKKNMLKRKYDWKNDTLFLSVVTDPKRILMDELARSIKREDDVLYLVVMKDYFLLPMVSGNATTPPRVSIVIPALAKNSPNSSSLKMLRIDTQVVGTGLFLLPDNLASVLNQSDLN